MALVLSNIFTIILAILIIFSLFIILFYGFRTRVEYSTEINDKLPSNDPPAVINSLYSGRITKNQGEINIKSFYLTLLDLVNRNYISIKLVTKKNSSENEKRIIKIILKVTKKTKDRLVPFEKNVLNCIAVLDYKGNANILSINEIVRKRLRVNTFQKNYDNWIKNIYKDFFKDNEKLINHKFKTILNGYGAFLVIIFIVSLIISFLTSIEESYLNLILGVLLAIIGISLLTTPLGNIGGLSKEGYNNYVKWDLFKKYYLKNLESNKSSEFLDKGLKYLPYLYGLGVSKNLLIKNLGEATNVSDAYIFLKYVDESLIRNIVNDFLAADGSFDPEYYNTTGNFVPGFGW